MYSGPAVVIDGLCVVTSPVEITGCATLIDVTGRVRVIGCEAQTLEVRGTVVLGTVLEVLTIVAGVIFGVNVVAEAGIVEPAERIRVEDGWIMLLGNEAPWLLRGTVLEVGDWQIVFDAGIIFPTVGVFV